MILEPKHKNFAGPSEIKETVKKRFNIRRHMSTPRPFECYYFYSCCRTAGGGVSQRALSLSAHMAGGPPPLLAPGRVTSPRPLIGV